jgi:hypothetical protein
MSMLTVWNFVSGALSIEGPFHIRVVNLFIGLMRWRNTSRYLRAIGRAPNYVEPRSYSEKMQYRKLFDRNPFFNICCDKLAARAFVEEADYGLKFPALLWEGDDPDQIPFDDFTVPYIIKPNARSGAYVAVTAGRQIDRAEVRHDCRQWLDKPYGQLSGEWGYRDVPRGLFVEALLPSETDSPFPDDYKSIVIGGRVEFIFHLRGVKGDNCQTFFDRSWNRLGQRKWKGLSKPGKRDTSNLPYVEKPAQFDRMIEIAEHIGRDIDQIRVDLYCVGGDIYFGEFTAYEGSGHHYLFPEDAVFEDYPPYDVDEENGRNWKVPTLPLSVKLRRAMFG